MDFVRSFLDKNITRGININIKGTIDAPLFQANQIAALLGISNIHTTIKDFNEDEKVICKHNTAGGDQNIVFLPVNGVKRLIVNSRKPIALDLAREIGMDIFNYKVAAVETVTLRQIMEAFNGEEMVLQNKVDAFYTDLYFPKYNLTIECDENPHRFSVAKDLKRQQHIQAKNGGGFIRYAPQTKDFSIFKVINQIHKFILSRVEAHSDTALPRQDETPETKEEGEQKETKEEEQKETEESKVESSIQS